MELNARSRFDFKPPAVTMTRSTCADGTNRIWFDGIVYFSVNSGATSKLQTFGRFYGHLHSILQHWDWKVRWRHCCPGWNRNALADHLWSLVKLFSDLHCRTTWRNVFFTAALSEPSQLPAATGETGLALPRKTMCWAQRKTQQVHRQSKSVPCSVLTQFTFTLTILPCPGALPPSPPR